MQFPGSGNPIRPGGYSPLEFVQASTGRGVPQTLAQQAADFVRLRLAQQAAQGVSFGAPQAPVLQMAAPQDGLLQMMPHGGPHGCGHFAMAAGAAPQNPFAQMMAGALASGMSITMTLNPPEAMPFALQAPPEAVPPRQTAFTEPPVQTPPTVPPVQTPPTVPPCKAAPTADVPPQKAAPTALPQKAAPTAPPQKTAPTVPARTRPMTLSEILKNKKTPVVAKLRLQPKPLKVKLDILKNKKTPVVPKLLLPPTLKARPPARPPPKAMLRPSTVPRVAVSIRARRLPTVPKFCVVRLRTAESQQPPDDWAEGDMFGEAEHGDMELEEPPLMEGPAEEPEVWDDEHAAEESEDEPEAEEP